MSAVTELVVNVISLAIITWLVVLFYFSYEDYRSGSNFCITKDTIAKTANVFDTMYNSANKKINREPFEERELVPYEMQESVGPQVERVQELAPQYSEPDDSEDYSEVLLNQLEPVILEQHAAYAKDSNHATRGASNQVERSNTEDVVQQWGLRRIRYGKDMLTKNATSVPSFEYSDEKTRHTNFGDLVGA